MNDFLNGAAPQPQTRAQRRAMAEADEQSASVRHARANRRRGRSVTFWVTGGIAAVAILSTAWLGFRAFNVANSLTAAESLIGTAKEQAASMDLAGLAQTSELLNEHTQSAVSQTEDPLWAVSEYLPVLGRNFTAVREMAEVVDGVAGDTIAPLATVAGGLSTDSLKPVDGRINVEPLVQLSGAIGPAAEALHRAAVQGAGIDVSGSVAPVRDAGNKLATMLTSADTMMGSAASLVQVMPELLGANGPRTYVLMFQNLAEATALGGTAAALSEVHVDNGAISIGRQASSGDFPWRDGNPVVTPDPNVEAIFEPLMYTRLNLSTSRPDFPTAAGIAKAFWQDHIGGNVDAVISVDPVALSYILGATGPVSMSTGDQLTPDNAVSLLLNEVYFRYQDDVTLSDAFFEEAAKNIFQSLMAPSTDAPKLVEAVARGVAEHRIMAWSSNPDIQETLSTTPMAGILPTTNEQATTTGVFFRDMSASKMDFYLKTSASLEAKTCSTGPSSYEVKVALRSELSAETAATLPWYVASGLWGTEHFRTQVFVYGPPGTVMESATVESAGRLTTHDLTGADLGRPVTSFMVWLAPGQRSEISAKFVADSAPAGAPALTTTPMLNPTAVKVTSSEECAG